MIETLFRSQFLETPEVLESIRRQGYDASPVEVPVVATEGGRRGGGSQENTPPGPIPKARIRGDEDDA